MAKPRPSALLSGRSICARLPPRPTGRFSSCPEPSGACAWPVHLRGRIVELHFNPFDWARVEIWHEDKFVALARLCDKRLNSRTYTDSDYDRPDKSS